MLGFERQGHSLERQAAGVRKREPRNPASAGAAEARERCSNVTGTLRERVTTCVPWHGLRRRIWTSCLEGAASRILDPKEEAEPPPPPPLRTADTDGRKQQCNHSHPLTALSSERANRGEATNKDAWQNELRSRPSYGNCPRQDLRRGGAVMCSAGQGCLPCLAPARPGYSFAIRNSEGVMSVVFQLPPACGDLALPDLIYRHRYDGLCVAIMQIRQIQRRVPQAYLGSVVVEPADGVGTDGDEEGGGAITQPCPATISSRGPDYETLDIEWLLLKPNSKQRVVITYFGGKVYAPVENFAFAGDYLKGDASLLIGDLMLTDSGEYTCKVKAGGKYDWTTVNLIVLVKPSKPRCWMEGQLLEGSNVKLSCKSADGSDPILYKWERVVDKGKSMGKLPSQALVDLKNPEIVTLQNLTQDSTGVYRCTASNDVGEENCLIEVTMHYVRGIGMVAGAMVCVSFGVLLIILITWLVFRKKEKKKYEEDETPNEIREDAEAPKAKLVKPNSLSSSRSGSSRSGASSTQSMVHNSAPRGHRPRPPAVAALKENGQTPSFPQSPPAYTEVVLKTPEPSTPKLGPGNLTRMGATPVMIPAQSKAFQTV
ncbi:hypothetical protein SKAU_G00089240 [Synaphobranchus kaupii]|uniref:Ig-like domain-containing protein n=1 Tax=Synaphobranchus kaupii TaxID=118154 RepID=A0A9Q1J6A0_SYNKA|nr:hypothetical protein SKAU_G00089240 [Synaphobranchus kaupii]